MSSIELTSSQRTILAALANLYQDSEDAVKGKDIATEANQSPDTIRNQIRNLKTLQLIGGVPGPEGGYKPTASAYETLDVDKIDGPAFISLFHNDEEVEGVNVDEIDLSSIHHPKLCRAEIHVQGSVHELRGGGKICVDPAPLSKLVTDGTLNGKDDMDNILILHIDDMQASIGEPQH